MTVSKIWDVFVQAVIWLAVIGFCFAFLVYLWERPWLLATMLVIMALICLSILKEKVRRKREGYWIEYISEGILRADEGEFAVVYHDDKLGDIYFECRWIEGKGRILFPSPEDWSWKVPVWAKDKRELILSRIRKEYRRICESVQ